MKDILNLRMNIDETDRKIVKLLLLRFRLIKQISKFKKSNKLRIFDKNREQKVLLNVKKLSGQHQEFIIKIFKYILIYSRKLQNKNFQPERLKIFQK